MYWDYRYEKAGYKINYLPHDGKRKAADGLISTIKATKATMFGVSGESDISNSHALILFYLVCTPCTPMPHSLFYFLDILLLMTIDIPDVCP